MKARRPRGQTAALVSAGSPSTTSLRFGINFVDARGRTLVAVAVSTESQQEWIHAVNSSLASKADIPPPWTMPCPPESKSKAPPLCSSMPVDHPSFLSFQCQVVDEEKQISGQQDSEQQGRDHQQSGQSDDADEEFHSADEVVLEDEHDWWQRQAFGDPYDIYDSQ